MWWVLSPPSLSTALTAFKSLLLLAGLCDQLQPVAAGVGGRCVQLPPGLTTGRSPHLKIVEWVTSQLTNPQKRGGGGIRQFFF